MKLCIRWCEFAYNGILVWSLILTCLHFMFYSLQLFLHDCLRKSSDLMLDVVAGIYWVLANIALVISTTLRDLEQRREISHAEILPHRSFMPTKLSSYMFLWLMLDVRGNSSLICGLPWKHQIPISATTPSMRLLLFTRQACKNNCNE